MVLIIRSSGQPMAERSNDPAGTQQMGERSQRRGGALLR